MNRFLYFLLLLLHLNSFGQTYIVNEEFNGGVTPPTNWVFTSIGGTYTTATNFGNSSPALQLNGTNDRVETPTVSCPDQLSFWIKGQGTDASSALLVEWFNGSVWASLDNITPLPTVPTTKTYSLSSSTTKIRFTYTKSVGNLSFDDVKIRQGICSGGKAPHITGVLVNSCNGTCSEGDNEIIFLNSGDISIPVTASNMVIKYENVDPPTTTYSDAITSNATYISTLNTNAGCGTIFYDAVTAGTIPANSIFCIMKSTACYSYIFSDLCGTGNIYVVFSTDVSWTSGGNFTNGGVGTRYFISDFSNVVSGSTFTYSYTPTSLTNGSDGDGIYYGYGGGAPAGYFNTGCTHLKLFSQ